MSGLGLNDHHQQQAVNFIRFCRYKRGQRLKGLDHCFQDLKDGRLYEETYTIDEVTDMLDDLLTVCRSEVENELLNSNHTSVLLMRQMLTQSEKWHLKLDADISELENRELLEQIADFEEREFSLTGSSSNDGLKQKPKLAPLNEGGGTALLQMEIERLKEELNQNKKRSQKLEEQVTACLREKNALQKQVEQLGQKPVSTVDSAVVTELEHQMKILQSEFSENLTEKATQNEALAKDLTYSKHELLKVKEQLELAEKELDKKFRETAAYRNMKDMLTKKNEQMKELRKKLSKYDPAE